MYKKVKKTNGLLVENYIEEVLTPPSKTKKAKIRHKIEEEVFDIEDSVADNSKLISLIFSLGETIYSVLSDAQKNKIPKEKRELIEYAILKFNETQTWGDLQIKEEGKLSIDTLLERQGKISKIIKGFENGK